MQTKTRVIAILCADIHLSLNPPVWRSNEPDWFAAMKRPLDAIKALQATCYNCPVFCAGDIFDKWDSSAELINWAVDNLPDKIYAIPGQHDMPEHNLDLMDKSAYTTLCKAEKIKTFKKQHTYTSVILNTYGFPFGKEIKSAKKETYSNIINMAVAHQYVWYGNNKHNKTTAEQCVGNLSLDKNGRVKGYDVIVFGDNHKGFITKVGKTTIFNCGSLMRRKSDEDDYKPMIGLLYNDGRVLPCYLDISKDKYLESVKGLDENEEADFDMSAFANELTKLGKSALDFTEAMKLYMQRNKVNSDVVNLVLNAMEIK